MKILNKHFDDHSLIIFLKLFASTILFIIFFSFKVFLFLLEIVYKNKKDLIATREYLVLFLKFPIYMPKTFYFALHLQHHNICYKFISTNFKIAPCIAPLQFLRQNILKLHLKIILETLY